MGVHGLSLLLADRLVGVHSSLNSPTLKATPTYTSKILHDPVQGESAEPVTAKAFLCAVRDLGWQYCQQECRGQPGGEAAIARTKRGPRCIWLERLSLRHVQDIQVGTAEGGCTMEQNPGDGLAGLLLGNSLTMGCACPMSGWSFLQAQHTVSPQTSAERLEERKTGLQTEKTGTHLMGA